MIINFILHSIYQMSLLTISTHVERSEENKTRRKSIDEQTRNILRGPIASLIVSKKSNFKEQPHRLCKKAIFKFHFQKVFVGFHAENVFQYQYWWVNIYSICIALFFKFLSCMRTIFINIPSFVLLNFIT